MITREMFIKLFSTLYYMGKLTTPKYPHSPVYMDTQTAEFIESLEDRLHRIDAIRVDDNSISVLGSDTLNSLYYEIIKRKLSSQESDFSFKDIDIASTCLAKVCTLGLYALTKGVRNRKKQREMYYQKIEQYKKTNKEEGEDKLKHLMIYQGNITEVEEELGPLKRVDTGNVETFLSEESRLLLRIKAYQLKADAIVHYVKENDYCYTGTPVKKKN